MLGQLPFTGSGKHFIVGDSGTANIDMLKQVFGYDPSGTLRFFADLDSAVGACTADAGDCILVMPGHTETLTTAADIALDVAGIKVLGLGTGESRPKFTFSSTDNAATMTASADSVALKNVILIGNDDALTNMLVVTGDGFDIDIETRDTSSAVESATAVRLDTANKGKLKLRHLGFTGGNAMVSCVRVDDCDDIEIEIDGYGVVSTAWVELVDASSTNVKVEGTLYTQGVTNMTRLVVDTIGSSTWFAKIDDRSAGSVVLGSNVTAFADADISSIAADIALIKAYTSGTDSAANVLGADDADNGFASTNVADNRDGSVLERLETVIATLRDDVASNYIGIDDADNTAATTNVADNRDGSLLERTETIIATLRDDVASNYIGTDSANSAAATSSVTANGNGTVLERLESLQQMTRHAISNAHPNYITVTADMTSATWNTQATHEIATVTGMVAMTVIPQVTSTLTDAADGSSIQLGIEGTTNALIASTGAAGAGGNTLETNEFWVDATPADKVFSGANWDVLSFAVGGGLDVGYEITGAALTGGTIIFHIWWTPLDATGAVTAGAGGSL